MHCLCLCRRRRPSCSCVARNDGANNAGVDVAQGGGGFQGGASFVECAWFADVALANHDVARQPACKQGILAWKVTGHGVHDPVDTGSILRWLLATGHTRRLSPHPLHRLRLDLSVVAALRMPGARNRQCGRGITLDALVLATPTLFVLQPLRVESVTKVSAIVQWGLEAPGNAELPVVLNCKGLARAAQIVVPATPIALTVGPFPTRRAAIERCGPLRRPDRAATEALGPATVLHRLLGPMPPMLAVSLEAIRR
mmetsp:Transcript_34621/g.104495  ORF Transcript_34621/g.104495 Transcript_34621/m.104495 type:complete len:255 (+) Transcript_34621:877-1641(+)